MKNRKSRESKTPVHSLTKKEMIRAMAIIMNPVDKHVIRMIRKMVRRARKELEKEEAKRRITHHPRTHKKRRSK